jgi:tetratricopeptide (TPR) repeat protein
LDPELMRAAQKAAWRGKVGRLWQMPMLVFSVALFGVAAWLFIDPKPGLTIDQKIATAETFLKQERPEAAIEYLNRLLAKEKLEKDREAEIRLMLAEGLWQGQKQRKINVPENHRRIVEQTLLAMELGGKPTSGVSQRMAESLEALGRPTEALTYYRRAMMMDPNKSLRIQRKIIELQLGADDTAGAAASIEDYLARKELTDGERAWAMGEQAGLLIDRGEVGAARRTLEDALRLNVDSVDLGQITYWLGYCEWKLNQRAEAERYLRLAREQLKVAHPLDADACFVLGRIAQEAGRHDEANSYFNLVITSHPESKVAVTARLGRGVSRIAMREDDAGLTDFHDVTNYVNQKEAVKKKYKVDVLVGLKTASKVLTDRGNFQGALELMSYEQTIAGEVPPSFYARLASVYERRAEQVENNIPDSIKAADRITREQQVRDLRAKAGDGFIAYSRALTLSDDKGYGEALWRGVDLYDRAGDLNRMISALELFAAERPEDALTPDALLRLGKAYQAAGQFDKAIASYQRNQFRYPNTLAASKSAVPLAQAYVAKGPEFYGRAESVLTGVVDNNPLVTPEAAEFRQALFELAQLFYRTGRYEEAVAKLEELVQRYPKDERMGQLVFLQGDSYRKSAGLLGVSERVLISATQPVRVATTQATPGADPVEVATARRERLNRAKGKFDEAIDIFRRMPPSSDVDRLYLKLAHFYRADCVFDLGGYEDAIKLYDGAAFRYQDDPAALAAYVQIVNAYCALGKFAEAKTANERAKWLLKKMPEEAFKGGGFNMPKEYWEKWLSWTASSGVW